MADVQAWLRCSGVAIMSAEASVASSIVQIARCHKPQALYEAGRAVVTAMDAISGKGTKAVQGLVWAGRMTVPSAKRPGRGHPRAPWRLGTGCGISASLSWAPEQLTAWVG